MADDKDKIVNFPGATKLNIPADRILEQAIGKLDEVVIVGFTKNGDEFQASSCADGAECLWLLELAKKRLFEMYDELQEG